MSHEVCCSVPVEMALSRGDVLFNGGEEAQHMFPDHVFMREGGRFRNSGCEELGHWGWIRLSASVLLAFRALSSAVSLFLSQAPLRPEPGPF